MKSPFTILQIRRVSVFQKEKGGLSKLSLWRVEANQKERASLFVIRFVGG